MYYVLKNDQLANTKAVLFIPKIFYYYMQCNEIPKTGQFHNQYRNKNKNDWGFITTLYGWDIWKNNTNDQTVSPFIWYFKTTAGCSYLTKFYFSNRFLQIVWLPSRKNIHFGIRYREVKTLYLWKSPIPWIINAL